MSVIRKASVFAAVLLGFCVSTARAQEMIVARIPFAFVVGSSTLPAGRYEIRPMDNVGATIFAIEGKDSPSEFAFAVTNPASGRDPAGDEPVLVFTRSENQYRLAQIWDSSSEGRELPNLSPRRRDRRGETQSSLLKTQAYVVATLTSNARAAG
jgi:hypothetical protein